MLFTLARPSLSLHLRPRRADWNMRQSPLQQHSAPSLARSASLRLRSSCLPNDRCVSNQEFNLISNDPICAVMRLRTQIFFLSARQKNGQHNPQINRRARCMTCVPVIFHLSFVRPLRPFTRRRWRTGIWLQIAL